MGGRAGTALGHPLVLTQIVPYSSSLYTVFHCVIYNSVFEPKIEDLLKKRIFQQNHFWLLAMKKKLLKIS